MQPDHPNVTPADPPRYDEQFDRMPPHDLGAERSLLGSLMLSEDDPVLYAKVGGIIGRDDFFQADHQIVYDALVDLRRRRRPIDGVLLCAYLRERGLLDEIGGLGTIGQILNTVPTSAHGEYYARAVHAAAVARGLISLGNRAIRDGYAAGHAEDLSAALSRLAADAAALSVSGKVQAVHRIGDVVAEVAAAGRRQDNASRLLPTGLDAIDRVIGGLPVGGHTLVAGKPGMGKSLLLKQFALNLSASGVPVGIISVEETRQKIAENALANRAGVVNGRIAHGTASAEEWDRVDEAAAALADAPYHIVDSASTLSDILAMAELLVHQHRCRVVMVDHLHIIDGQPGRNENREREVSNISAGLKFAWKRLAVAGVCAAQLNRGSGRDRPTLTSLRDSGSLEADGDVVLLVHREDYYRKQDGAVADLDGLAEVIVAKNKSGAAGVVVVRMDEARQRVEDRPEEVNAAVADAMDAFSVSEGWR